MLNFVLKSALQGSRTRTVQALASMAASENDTLRHSAAMVTASDRMLKSDDAVALKIILVNYVCDRLNTTHSVMDRALTSMEVKSLRGAWPPRPVGAKGSALKTLLLDYRLSIRYGGPYIDVSFRDAVSRLKLSAKEKRLVSKLIDNVGNLQAVSNLVPCRVNRSQLKRLDAAITEVLGNESFWGV